MIEKIENEFSRLFGKEGDYYFAPGRINLIGEHTDYNMGYVLPGAIDRGITCKIAKNSSGTVRLYALDITDENNYVEFSLTSNEKPSEHWACYIYGVCREMIKRGIQIEGFSAVFMGNIPLGAGLSSSAALESLFAFALNNLYADCQFSKLELAKIGQDTEHNYCNVKCGLMDQFASIFGKSGSLIRLDCQSLNHTYIPFNPKGYNIVLVNSLVKHSLGTEYNDRRESCNRVVDCIAKQYPNVHSLREATIEQLLVVKNVLDNTDFLRAKYVIEENQRVLDVCKALEEEDYATVGEKMYETHWGLSKEYTVSCKELDLLVSVAQDIGVEGSRVMGGGFGGCTINLVSDSNSERFKRCVTDKFEQQFGHKPDIYTFQIGEGARKL